jgi:hypothetical protein
MSADTIPALPSAPTHGLASWPPNVLQGYDALSSLYSAAILALQSDSESHRLNFHLDSIVNDAFPILLAFEEGADSYPSLLPWLKRTATLYGNLFDDFCKLGEKMKGKYVQINIHLIFIA